MLTSDLLATLLAPINAESPSGADLEYDPAYIALESEAQGKPEQQFGDTVIPAVEPDWAQITEQGCALLERSKDVRVAMLLLRAATRRQGLVGFGIGLHLLHGLLERFWDDIHPQLDADDDNDPTMRVNALAPLWDDALVLRDLYDARLGEARGIGLIRVRDVAIARNALAGASNYTPAQVQGALELLLPQDALLVDAMRESAKAVLQLQQLVEERSGRSEAIDLSRLRTVAQVLRLAATEAGGASTEPSDSAPEAGTDAAIDAVASGSGVGTRNELMTRQDALAMLDRVIHFLQQTEPGNPAPLLIERAKKLIGVSFLDIIANLAPDAMSTIEHVTGARPQED